jgi:hypothetical protein
MKLAFNAQIRTKSDVAAFAGSGCTNFDSSFSLGGNGSENAHLE